MSIALYRKYRPSLFEDLIGQEQSVIPLQKAIENDRVAHAYIFSGPRGCGKTTSARIFARCLNCHKDNKPQKTPCGECVSCKELANDKSDSLDVLEIDGASNNGVDSARELREKLSYSPVRDRYKIVILDEAHRMTPSAFDALLKIVEEPPEHIKFIFATTDPSKLLTTIRSRSYEYPFRLVPANILKLHIEKILESEKITAETGVIELAIKNGTGSVRDTLSVLDQLIASNENGLISYDVALKLLGYASISSIEEVTKSILKNNQNALIQQLLKQIENGIDFKMFLDDLLEYFSKLIIAKFDESVKFEDLSNEQIKQVLEFSREFEIERLKELSTTIFESIKNYDDTILNRNNVIVFSSIIIPGSFKETTPIQKEAKQNAVHQKKHKITQTSKPSEENNLSKQTEEKTEKEATKVTEEQKETKKTDKKVNFKDNLLKGKVKQAEAIIGFEKQTWEKVLDIINNDEITLKTLLTNAKPGELELTVMEGVRVDEEKVAEAIFEITNKKPQISIQKYNEEQDKDKDVEKIAEDPIKLIQTELGGKIVEGE